jgi:6-pyruvoyl-tetrahydropterin synthase
VKVKIRSEKLNEWGMVVDFIHVKGIIKEYDHKYLIQEGVDSAMVRRYSKASGIIFLQKPPTAENLAEHLAYRIQEGIMDLPFYKKNKPVVEEVEIWETPSGCSIYRPQFVHGTNQAGLEAKASSGASEEQQSWEEDGTCVRSEEDMDREEIAFQERTLSQISHDHPHRPTIEGRIRFLKSRLETYGGSS